MTDQAPELLPCPQTHYLKTWPEYFNEVLSGRKPFEWRVDDRNFKVGDRLILQEYIPNPENPGREGQYTGREITKIVSYMFSPWPTNKRTVVMAFTRPTPAERPVPQVREALGTAIGHIEHMAAWITERNIEGADYSFESLGEDMPGIREALYALSPDEPARVTPSTVGGEATTVLIGKLRARAINLRQRDVNAVGEANVEPIQGFFDWQVAAELERLSSPTIASEKERGKAVGNSWRDALASAPPAASLIAKETP